MTPPAIEEVRDYNLATVDGRSYTVPLAERIAPGLLVYRLPAAVHPQSPYRWRIGHEMSGRSIADGMNHEDALAGARLLVGMADWTQTADSLQKSLDADNLYRRLSGVGMGCVQPGTDDMPGNVAHNGTYTDADIELYAAECKANEMNALEITSAMANTVPWMGLDTDDFNEVHGRICVLADAA
ncbi:hypothetical protein ACIGFK_13050 [Streptomyces sp. NPDC085524]|uniref:hypothetical protein n=1 Tax=Streptomyces sp. NPDC085524 TaxID=3365728 RepID=UPI0037D8BACD